MSLTRREVLAAFLGAPVALAACRRPLRVPPGELAATPEVLGHRLRDWHGALPRAERVTRPKVVIVGAGIAGLSAAWRLRRAGFDDFTVLELDAVEGGTARGGRSSRGGFPWGAHYVTAPMKEHRAMVTLLDEVGVLEGRTDDGEPIVAEQFLCRDPQERVFHEGRWHPGLYLYDGATPQDLAELDRFQREVARWASWRDGRGRRAFAIPTAMGTDDAEVMALDRISMRAWLDAQGYRSERLVWTLDYACRDDYGASLTNTSAWAGLFYHAARMRRAGDEHQPVITWPEGNGRLVRHLRDALGPRVETDAAVFDIAPVQRAETEGVDVTAMTRVQTTRRFEAEQVIVATPQFVAARMLRPWRDSAPSHIAEFEYGSWMVAHLMLSRRPRNVGFDPAWDNVIRDSPALGYVSNLHQRLVDHGPTHWTYYHPLCDDDPRAARRRLLSADRDAWADVALADLERAHPELRRLVERLDVMRWGHAMIRPRPGLRAALRAAREPVRGVHFAHTDLSGVALFEEAFDHGLRAAEEVLAARGVPFESMR